MLAEVFEYKTYNYSKISASMPWFLMRATHVMQGFIRGQLPSQADQG